MKKTAVIVEDDQMVAEGVASYIKKIGIETIGIYHEQKKGIEGILQKRPTITFIDIKLKNNGCGLKILKEIKANRHLKMTKIIFTSSEDTSVIERALKAGADGYWIKGGALEKIEAIIKAAQQDIIALDRKVANQSIIEKSLDSIFGEGYRKKELEKEEIDILECVSKGLRNKEIADILLISESQIKTKIKKIAKKMNLDCQECKDSHNRTVIAYYYGKYYS